MAKRVHGCPFVITDNSIVKKPKKKSINSFQKASLNMYASTIRKINLGKKPPVLQSTLCIPKD